MKTILLLMTVLSGTLAVPLKRALAMQEWSTLSVQNTDFSDDLFDHLKDQYEFNFSTDKGIYGDDNRLLVSELSDLEGDIKELSKSVLAQVPRWRVTSEDEDFYTITTRSLSKGMNFCPDEKFAMMPLVSSCTAFLIAPDLMLTAGHCLRDKYDCKNNFWLLDYDDELGFSDFVPNVQIKKSNVVSCESVISLQENSKFDYALVKIDRRLEDRKSFSIRKFGKVSSEASLGVIGHPMGLPKIITDRATIRNNSLPYTFVTNADTFSGNSGSPVINMETHLVEGILIRGDIDFQMDLDQGCNRAYHCASNECKGETALRTTELPFKLFPRF